MRPVIEVSEADHSASAPPVQYKIKITPGLVLAILGPYLSEKAKAQLSAVMPISLFLFLFQVVVLRQGVLNSIEITAGLTFVILGLMFFMEGLRLGLMPLGENIGAALPAKAAMPVILSFAVVLGMAATFAEPAISTLKAAGANISPAQSPLLFEMLNGSSALLVLGVAVGVGIATALGTYRFVRNWPLRAVIFPSLGAALVLTILAALNPITSGLISLAWDTGAVTTGPVTVPLVLALGLGVGTILGRNSTGLNGFGVVTLASLWPVVMVLAVGLAIFYTGSYGASVNVPGTGTAAGAADAGPTFVELLAGSIQTAAQAIIPLALLLYVVQRFVLRETVRNADQILLGIVFALVGMLMFNLGLGAGLVPLGAQVGGNVPNAFTPPQELYGETGGRVVALVFAFLLGYGATLAEPALNALGITVEDVTAGAFKRKMLMHAVALGVGLGLAGGLAKIMFDWPLAYLVIPSYLALILITLASDEKFVNIGWDSAGVTTGPITVPLVLAMGLGIGLSVGVPEGFGMLAVASVGPIFTVLLMGLIIKRNTRQADAAAKVSAP